MKLIYYSNAENQLFDLKTDPEELNSIKNSNLEQHLVDELILLLGEHPDTIADRVESYNRDSFMQWKNEQGRVSQDRCGPNHGAKREFERTVREALWKEKTTQKIFQTYDGKLISNGIRLKT